MNFIEYVDTKTTKRGFITTRIIFLTFVLSLFFYILSKPKIYAVFIFQSLDNNKLYYETRFVPNKTKQARIELYIQDLLLGPKTARLKPCFPAGTKLYTCFLRNNTLYIDLSQEALIFADNSIISIDSIEILKKNIFLNFNLIKTIHIYINGEEINDSQIKTALFRENTLQK